MPSIVISKSIVLATALATVSGATVILLAIHRQRALCLSLHPISHSANPKALRSCISSRSGNHGEKKKKRVQFADDVIDDHHHRQHHENIGEKLRNKTGKSSLSFNRRHVRHSTPANHMALYHGILQDRRARILS